MGIHYGQIQGYLPSDNGFVQLIIVPLTPGGNYDLQYSTDGGVTWLPAGSFSIHPGTLPAIADILLNLAVPGGVPVRVVDK